MHILTNQISQNYLKKWNEFIKNHPHNTVFQSPEMYEFYKKVQNFEPFLFYAEDNDKCVGVLLAVRIKEGNGLKGYFSSRVVVYGGPVVAETDNKVILDLMLKTLVRKLKNKSVFFQFRNFFEWKDEESAIFKKNGFVFRDRLNLLVDTTSEQKLMEQIKASKRRQIKKGLNSGVEIEDPKSESEVQMFYRLLYELYTTKVKKPLPSWSFFKSFYYFSKQGKLGIIKLIKLNDKIIGGILAPITKGKNIYEWYVVGLDKLYKKNYPSVIATYAPMKYAVDNNLSYFDFMGLGVPDKEYGVRDFKINFGNKIVNYGRFARRNNKLIYRFAEFGYNVLRKLK